MIVLARFICDMSGRWNCEAGETKDVPTFIFATKRMTLKIVLRCGESLPNFQYLICFLFIFYRMVNIFKLILQHIKEYCQQAGIHGPKHIVSEKLTRLERLVSYKLFMN